MSKNMQIPGTTQIKASKIVPPTATQIEQIWLQIPEFGKAINQLAYQVHNLQQQIGALQMSGLEQAYLTKHLATGLKIELPSLEAIRDEIRADRLTFLQAVLESDGVNEEQKVAIKKQIEELQTTIEEQPKEESSDEPTEETSAKDTTVAPADDGK